MTPPLRRLRLPAALAVLAMLLIAWPGHVTADDRVDGRPVAIDADPIAFDASDPDATRFGALEWLGGVELTSGDAAFGGYSGLVVSPDGANLIAVSDRGTWFAAKIVYGESGVLGLTDARTAAILSGDGRPLAPKSAQDAEALAPYDAAAPLTRVLVGLERDERILYFDLSRDGFAALPRLIALPEEAALGPNNSELEAVGRFSGKIALAGTIIALSERHLDDDGNVIGWLMEGPTPGRLTLRRSDDFSITDLAILPDGDMLVLERKLSPLKLAAMRIRRIDQETIAPGAVLDGETLLVAEQPRYAVDNMEALALHAGANGGMRLTIMSDDNFNPLQRTLLLQFALRGDDS